MCSDSHLFRNIHKVPIRFPLWLWPYLVPFSKYWLKNADFSYPFVFDLHDPVKFLQIFAQNFNTNCPSSLDIRRCKNIAEKFKSLPTVQQRCRQTDRRQTDRRLMLWLWNMMPLNCLPDLTIAGSLCAARGWKSRDLTFTYIDSMAASGKEADRPTGR